MAKFTITRTFKSYNYNFRTNSDTEVLIAGYQLKGISFVKDLRGV